MRARLLQRRDFVWRSFILNPLGRASVRLYPQFIAIVFLTLFSCTISGWGGRRGGNRQRADLCSPQGGCPRTRGQVTHICGRLCEYFSKSMIATCTCVCQLLIPL